MGIGMNGPEDPGVHSTPLHVPVLLETTLELLAPSLDRDGATTVVDATLGLGGHAEAMLTRFPRTTLIGVDRDPEALRLSGERLAPFGDRFRPAHAVYDAIPEVLDRLDLEAVDGVLFDLGVSSMQLDQDDRGFSYSRDVALDMRMDPGESRTAADIVNEYDLKALSRIFRVYGEERLADRYARAIGAAREVTPIRGSAELVDVLERATPAALKNRGHVGKRVFQALRIEVNRELEVLERAVPAALDRISTGGRIVVLSYHSLEDRIVKRALAAPNRLDRPARAPGRDRRDGPHLPDADAGRTQGSGGRGGTEPESRIRAAPGGGADPGGSPHRLTRMSHSWGTVSLSTAYAFDPVRRPLPARPVEAAPVVSAPPAAASARLAARPSEGAGRVRRARRRRLRRRGAAAALDRHGERRLPARRPAAAVRRPRAPAAGAVRGAPGRRRTAAPRRRGGRARHGAGRLARLPRRDDREGARRLVTRRAREAARRRVPSRVSGGAVRPRAGSSGIPPRLPGRSGVLA